MVIAIYMVRDKTLVLIGMYKVDKIYTIWEKAKNMIKCVQRKKIYGV